MPRTAAALAALLFAAPAFAQTLKERQATFDALVNEMWEWNLREHPEFATMVGDKRYNDRLSDFSIEAVERELAQDRKFLDRALAIDPAGFPEQQAITHQIVVRSMKEELEGAKFRDYEMPVSQVGGIHIQAPQLVTLTPFETVKDYENYLARLHALPKAFAQTEAMMRRGMANGLMPPKLLLEKVVTQTQKLSKQKPEESPFFAPASKFPASIAAADQKRLKSAIAAAIGDQVLPAYRRFGTFVEKEYAPKGRKDPGIWSLPDGEARYAYAVRVMTTTDMSPEEIHQLGLREVQRDRAAMLEIAKSLGYADLKSFDAAIQKNPDLHPRSREAMLDAYRKYIDAMWSKLPQQFGRIPKGKLQVMPVEPYREKEASGAQIEPGSLDGKRPAFIKVNTGDIEKRTTLDIETTAYHEGVPGHHMQIAIAQELPALPPLRQYAYFGAFIEGWALYAERLAEEMGAYQDPYSRYGHLQDDLLRAIRLVADTGYHHKRWTREQVVDFFHQNSGIDEPNVQSETDRYVAWPAQALAYKIGQLEFVELKAKARQELGPKYDVHAFHDLVLSGGALPLDVLQARVDAWIASQKAAGRTASH